MFFSAVRTAAFAALLILLCSCANTRGQSVPDEREELENRLSRQTRELEVRLSEIEYQVSDLKREFRFTQEQVAALQGQSGRMGLDNQASLNELRGRVKSVEDELKRATAIIMEEIRKLEKTRSQRAPARAGEVMRGYEHTVQSGETLSTIARKYGASVPAITEANGMSDPNAIRVGQTIFVPAP